MRDATIITPDKNKGDRSECNNYRGISLMSIVRKLFFRVLFTRLHAHPHHRVYRVPVRLPGERSTTDMIFTVHHLQEKSREQGKPLYLT